jgi:hypothetical protein
VVVVLGVPRQGRRGHRLSLTHQTLTGRLAPPPPNSPWLSQCFIVVCLRWQNA